MEFRGEIAHRIAVPGSPAGVRRRFAIAGANSPRRARRRYFGRYL